MILRVDRRIAWLLAGFACWLTGVAQAGTPSAHRLDEIAPREIQSRYLLVGPDRGAVSDQDFHGRFQLIAFGYTYCPDICPTTLVEMAEVLRQLADQASEVQGIFISVDQERDTPAVLKTYTTFFDPRILGLSGSPALVQRAARNFKVRYAKVADSQPGSQFYAVDHSAGLYLLDRQGSFIKKFGYGTPPQEIVETLRPLIGPR